jgi:hypothetical protein
MDNFENTAPAPPQPEPGTPSPEAPEGDPQRGPEPVPWHDPGPPVRKVNLPPDSPSPGVPIPKSENPMIT